MPASTRGVGVLPSRNFNSVSRHGAIAGGFIACAMVLGGGGSPSPKAEILVQTAFVVAALTWLWWASEEASGNPVPRPLILFGLALMSLPILQLVPLPPSLWQSLPGRELEVATLSLIGEAHSWRPLTISAPRTLAGLLALLPAVGVMWAISALDARDRRSVVLVIAVIGLAGAALGAMQMAGGPDAFRLYEKSHRGWLTAFHANRNAAADVLLIASLALTAWFCTMAQRRPKLSHRLPLFAAAQLVLAIAILMTGSRAGIALLAVSLPFHWAIFATAGYGLKTRATFGAAGAIFAGLFALPLVIAHNSRFARVAERFDATSDARVPLWQDTLKALDAFWPAGSGIGTFTNAFLPFEDPAHLDPFSPNRAHNDYFEFLLEAGLFAPVLLIGGAAVLFVLARRAWRLSPQEHALHLFALGTLAIVALHSFVDYPLRNMAIACLAGVAAGLLTATTAKGGSASAREGRKDE